jgi:hypothetical protein
MTYDKNYSVFAEVVPGIAVGWEILKEVMSPIAS